MKKQTILNIVALLCLIYLLIQSFDTKSEELDLNECECTEFTDTQEYLDLSIGLERIEKSISTIYDQLNS